MAYLEKLQHKAPAALVAAASIGILVPYEIYAQAPGQNMNTIIARGDYGLTYSTDANAKPEEFK